MWPVFGHKKRDRSGRLRAPFFETQDHSYFGRHVATVLSQAIHGLMAKALQIGLAGKFER